MQNKKYKIGIAGCGMVGGAVKKYFENKPNYEVFIYDKKGLGSMADINRADYIYVCLPTPYVEGVGCDVGIIESVIEELTEYSRDTEGDIISKVFIIKSTVTPGTTQKLQDKYPQHKFLFNPEFLTEVTADNDMAFPDRQIIGYTEQSYTIAKDVLQQLPLAPYERIVKSEEAEMIKYFGNNWFALKVVFANQMYDLCMKMGIDYEAVKDGAAADKRIGRTHLDILHKGGRGAGGKCLRKDLGATVEYARKNGLPLPLLEKAKEINDYLLTNFGRSKYVQ